MKKNYYLEIDNALKSYEEFKPWHEKSLDWICDRILWCWNWKKISTEQMQELADRAVECLKRN